ncbi:hypothetical protein ACH4PU_31970 [Streptomyces sp. NPDC021100]
MICDTVLVLELTVEVPLVSDRPSLADDPDLTHLIDLIDMLPHPEVSDF